MDDVSALAMQIFLSSANFDFDGLAEAATQATELTEQLNDASPEYAVAVQAALSEIDVCYDEFFSQAAQLRSYAAWRAAIRKLDALLMNTNWGDLQ